MAPPDHHGTDDKFAQCLVVTRHRYVAEGSTEGQTNITAVDMVSLTLIRPISIYSLC